MECKLPYTDRGFTNRAFVETLLDAKCFQSMFTTAPKHGVHFGTAPLSMQLDR